jgi:hypothetical protein
MVEEKRAFEDELPSDDVVHSLADVSNRASGRARATAGYPV